MKNPKLKSIISVFLLISLVLVATSCNSGETSSTAEIKESSTIDESANESSSETEKSDSPESLFPSFVFDEPKDSGTDLSKKEYVSVSSLPEKNKASKVPDAKDGYTYFDVSTGIFEITGIVAPQNNDEFFKRLPMDNLPDYSSDNASLSNMLAGGRIRFVTDAETFVLYAKMGQVYKLAYFCAKGAYGFDVYTGTGTNRKYVGASGNHLTSDTTLHSVVDLGKGYKEVTIILPSYGAVNDLYIGLPDKASVATPDKYKYNDPICFYGSSITQGASVTRPGVAYPTLLTLALDANCYNLGFSGSAKGEQSIAEYIASMNISAFVMDYDYNAPDTDHLKATHYDFYKTVRKAHPDIPVILLSHPYYKEATEEDEKRVAIVKETYDKAISEGDKNIYFIDSEAYFPEGYRSIVTVDNLHPNDIGHLLMAEAVYPVLKAALENK